MKWTSGYDILDEARGNAKKWQWRALITAAVVAGLAYYLAPFPIPPTSSVADRLAFALRWQIPPLGTLLFGILAVANKRFHSRALDPVNGKDQEALILPVRYLQNTVEQLLFSAGSQMALVTYLEPHQLQLIPTLALLFVAGRLTFWIGYQQPKMSYSNRYFGYVLTVSPSIFAYGYCCLKMLLEAL